MREEQPTEADVHGDMLRVVAHLSGTTTKDISSE